MLSKKNALPVKTKLLTTELRQLTQRRADAGTCKTDEMQQSCIEMLHQTWSVNSSCEPNGVRGRKEGRTEKRKEGRKDRFLEDTAALLCFCLVWGCLPTLRAEIYGISRDGIDGRKYLLAVFFFFFFSRNAYWPAKLDELEQWAKCPCDPAYFFSFQRCDSEVKGTYCSCWGRDFVKSWIQHPCQVAHNCLQLKCPCAPWARACAHTHTHTHPKIKI